MIDTAAAPPGSVRGAEFVLFPVLLQPAIITFAGRIGGVIAQRFRQAALAWVAS